jgi:hypothetical protein
VDARKGQIEGLTSAESRGLGVRVIADGRLGFAYAADPSSEEVRRTVDRARTPLHRHRIGLKPSADEQERHSSRNGRDTQEGWKDSRLTCALPTGGALRFSRLSGERRALPVSGVVNAHHRTRGAESCAANARLDRPRRRRPAQRACQRSRQAGERVDGGRRGSLTFFRSTTAPRAQVFLFSVRAAGTRRSIAPPRLRRRRRRGAGVDLPSEGPLAHATRRIVIGPGPAVARQPALR